MKINELEKILNIGRANIRFYEKEGLINPSRKENGYREYSVKEVALLKKIIIYRKLGISISDIKNIFDGSISLQTAIAKSIDAMQNEISRMNISTEICREIQSKNINDLDFDEEYYWEEINSREADGEEFFDISNIDTSSFSSRKKASVFIAVFAVLFFSGIIYAMICGAIVHHNNDYYDVIQNEISTYSAIDTVKIDAENDRLYVCYDDATCVNVYNLEGDFLWAVSIPFAENSRGVTYFYIDNGRLIIDREDTYIYNSITGEFIEKTYSEKTGILDWRDNWENDHKADLEKAVKLGYAFDNYNVYKTDSNGSITKYIVEKPGWYILTNDIWGILTALVGAAGLAVIMLLSKFKQLNKLPANKNRLSKKAKIFILYLKALFSCLLIYCVLDITLAVLDAAYIMVGIFPVTAIFIITLIVFDILNKKFNDAEQKVCGIWRLYNILMYVVTIISTTIAICISG